ncbi:hypothetical protein NE237_022385 [Protea cynaroides]|uniref:Uncharacterized protein n=1 Tax=Protea cynaroides TaxID=273540 RepID=A0A9Q0K455_9MAGN|nr:hypothetical protein NE237_022385 [Protea cynaroides]
MVDPADELIQPLDSNAPSDSARVEAILAILSPATLHQPDSSPSHARASQQHLSNSPFAQHFSGNSLRSTITYSSKKGSGTVLSSYDGKMAGDELPSDEMENSGSRTKAKRSARLARKARQASLATNVSSQS